jgi:metal-responsive CopG/Arc/MetJ family transcriptional regulator
MQSKKEVTAVKMERVMVQLPKGIKAKLDGLRRQGSSISGFIRSIVERELNHSPTRQKGR